MKRTKKLFLAFALSAMCFNFAGCFNQFSEDKPESKESEVILVNNEDSSERDKLLDFAVIGNYKVEEDQVQEDLISFFNSMKQKDNSSRSASKANLSIKKNRRKKLSDSCRTEKYTFSSNSII